MTTEGCAIRLTTEARGGRTGAAFERFFSPCVAGQASALAASRATRGSRGSAKSAGLPGSHQMSFSLPLLIRRIDVACAAHPALDGGKAGRPRWAIASTVAMLCLVAAAAAAAPKPMLPFVENLGQFPEAFRFVARDSRSWVGVSPNGIHYLFGQDGEILTEVLAGRRPITPKGLATAVTRVSDFRGADSSRWLKDLPSFQSIGLGEIYPGIAVELQHGPQGVEKIFRVSPRASVTSIAIDYTRPHTLRIDDDGSLVVTLANGEQSIRFSRPAAFQEIAGQREPVIVRYRLLANGG